MKLAGSLPVACLIAELWTATSTQAKTATKQRCFRSTFTAVVSIVHAGAIMSSRGSLSYQLNLMKTLVTTSVIGTPAAQSHDRHTMKIGSNVRHNCQAIPTLTLTQSFKKSLFGVKVGSSATTR